VVGFPIFQKSEIGAIIRGRGDSEKKDVVTNHTKTIDANNAMVYLYYYPVLKGNERKNYKSIKSIVSGKFLKK
jgi:hypothetical protein